MNKRQVVVLWIIAVVLAAAAFFVRSGDSKGFESKTQRARGQTLLADFPAPEVAKIQVSSGGTTTTVVRKDGKWSVTERDGYPANLTTVNDILRTLTDVKVTQGIEAEPTVAPRFGMDPAATAAKDRGTEVVLANDAGSELARLTLGKNLESSSDPMSMMGGGASGRYVRNHADTSGFYVVSELFSSLSAEPKSWLEDDFLKVEKIKSVSVSVKATPDKIEWKLDRPDETGEFALEGIKEGEALDPAATAALKSLFSYARFEDVVPLDQVDAIAKPLEKRTVKIETFEGFVYTIALTPTEPEKPKENDPEAAPPEESVLMTVNVEATLPAERKKEEKETEDDAKTKDKAFTDRKAELEKRLAAEKALAGKTFKVTKYTVDALLKERAGLIKQPEAPAAAGGQLPPGGMPPGMMMPPGGGQAPPARRPVQAVTPPIAIPPLEEGEGEE
jgi:hypothetical protein